MTSSASQEDSTTTSTLLTSTLLALCSDYDDQNRQQAGGGPRLLSSSSGGAAAPASSCRPSKPTEPSAPPSATTTHPSPPTACAGCRFQRRRCLENCELALYFSPQEDLAFEAVHRLFGVKNFVRLLKDLPLHLRHTAVSTMKLEAQFRMADQVHGITRLMHQLKVQVKCLQQELIKLRMAIMKAERQCLHRMAHERAHLLQAVKAHVHHQPPIPTARNHGLEDIAFARSLVSSCQNSACNDIAPSQRQLVNNSGPQGDAQLIKEASQTPLHDDSPESASLAFNSNPNLDTVGHILDDHGFTCCDTDYIPIGTESMAFADLTSFGDTQPSRNQLSQHFSSYLNIVSPISSSFVDPNDFVAPISSINEDPNHVLATISSDEPGDTNLFQSL
ncbi:hypothetical protein GOP47_0011821 [Adiantum capillus-veneris]|uniref:LOB domain-containing protein n=1 Tax=Adiantum capillus-veneris TaxID=13818 RepID=A0A9D4ZFR6_ADICA|nr:hypothetical protein GOP47_0011821 [Adiantum capillus-veneris]